MNILSNRGQSMRFQIMVEVAINQPNIQQKDIAKKLGLTNQAISEYFQELITEGFIVSLGRSKYKLTNEGVNWLLQAYRGLIDYTSLVGKAVTNVTVCAAIADGNLKAGQKVGLIMKDGMLYATSAGSSAASGIAYNSATKGEDVGITSIDGLIELKKGKVILVMVPTVEKNGSRNVDYPLLQKLLRGKTLVGSLGLEAYATLRKAKRKPDYLYGVVDAAIEAANSGIDFCMVVSEDYYPQLISRLHEAGLEYEVHKAYPVT